MRLKRKILMLLSTILIIRSFPVYGQVNNYSEQENVSSVVVNKQSSAIESKITKMPRGRVLSSATLQISDEGNGILGVYADTLCHVSVKQINLVIYLDIWNEARQDWQSVDSYRYAWSSTDSPNGSLSMAVVSFDIEELSRGRKYRLRALHSAKSFDSISETMTTETNAIYLN